MAKSEKSSENKKLKYYNISNLLKTDAEYMMLLGQRSNGKSYQVKFTVLTDAFKGKKFVYLRRYKADNTNTNVESYFGDLDIKKITKGKYNEIQAFRGYIYFILRKKDGSIDVKSKMEIGRYCSLNEYERYKSQVFKDYDSIVYEEFITDGFYLNDEPRLLQQFVSTVFRLRKGHVFLVGNTLSRVCPYFAEWSLEPVLKQKQGTIDVYHFHFEDSIIDVAVEMCEDTQNGNTMFFGTSAKQIVHGDWDVKDYPKLPRLQYEYEKIYEMEVKYQAFRFVVELLVEPKNGGVILFVYPLTTDRKIYRVIQDEFSDLPNITQRLDVSKRPEYLISKALMDNKICYSDNLTGTDFAKVRELLLNY